MTLKISPGDAALVVDMQKCFMPGWELPVHEADKIIKPINDSLEGYETVAFSQCHHKPGHVSFASSHPGKKPGDIIRLANGLDQMLFNDHGIPGTKGAEFVDGLNTDYAHIILRKGTELEVDSYSPFESNPGINRVRRSTGLLGCFLERVVRRIVLRGVAGEYCVYFAAVSCGQTIPTVAVWDQINFVDPDNRKIYEPLYRKAGVMLV